VNPKKPGFSEKTWFLAENFFLHFTNRENERRQDFLLCTAYVSFAFQAIHAARVQPQTGRMRYIFTLDNICYGKYARQLSVISVCHLSLNSIKE